MCAPWHVAMQIFSMSNPGLKVLTLLVTSTTRIDNMVSQNCQGQMSRTKNFFAFFVLTWCVAIQKKKTKCSDSDFFPLLISQQFHVWRTRLMITHQWSRTQKAFQLDTYLSKFCTEMIIKLMLIAIYLCPWSRRYPWDVFLIQFFSTACVIFILSFHNH